VAVAAVQHRLRVLLDLVVDRVVVVGMPKQVAREHLDKEIRVVLVAQQQLLLLMVAQAAAVLVL
jgi:hypothetical protein